MSKFPANAAIYFSLLISFTTSAYAQQRRIQKPGIIVGANILYAAPQGSFKDAYSFGGGGQVFGGAGLGKTFAIATLGFSAFKTQSGIHSGTLTYVPFKIGIRRFLLGKILFVNADLGTAAVKNKNFSAARFTRGIGFGAKLPGLEAALYYDGWKNKNAGGFSNSINFKVGWSILL